MNLCAQQLVFAGTSLLSSVAAGQCELIWKPVPGALRPNHEIFAVATWDPDGVGPQGPVIVAGGNFFYPSVGVALWDGVQWKPMTSGVAGGNVAAVTAYDPDGPGPGLRMPVIGGRFTSVGGVSANKVARWDGSSWHPLGLGVGTGSQSVRDLVVHDGDLIAGGVFTLAGGLPTQGLARWDGTAWHNMAHLGVTSPHTLLSHGGTLYAGASIGVGQYGVLKFLGTGWEIMGPNPPNGPIGLGVFDGELWAGGSFFITTGSTHIARFDGSMWQPLLEGASDPVWRFVAWDPDGPGPMGERFVVGGGFQTIAGVEARSLATWDGTGFSPLGAGVEGAVYDLAIWNNELIVAGFFSTAGGISSPFFARYGCPGSAACEPDCNSDGVLNIIDFNCFHTAFVSGNPQADCNRDSALNLADFGCFMTKFALGCP